MKEDKKIIRCGWCKDTPLDIAYHDNEWGVEITDDNKLFEFLILESAQAGLSWETILRKREGYRKAFANFDIDKVSKFSDKDIERLINDTGIVRNRLKIKASISNANLFKQIQNEFGSFRTYICLFLPEGKPIINHWKTLDEVPASTSVSDAISKDMKKRGFKFFGTTICYAFLQATGYVDDHLIDCWCRVRTAENLK